MLDTGLKHPTIRRVVHEHDETHLPSLARSFPSLVVLFFYSHSSHHSHLPPTRYTPPTTPTSPFPSEPDKQSDTLEINTTPPHHYRPCLWCLAQLCRVHEQASLHPAVPTTACSLTWTTAASPFPARLRHFITSPGRSLHS